MPKMTTEQFLSHLGIEVGKEFLCKFPNEFIRHFKYTENPPLLSYYNHIRDNWNACENTLSDLLDREITPLPKYTLSEDEMSLVNGMVKGKLKRFNINTVAWEVDNITVAFFLNSYFRFVEEETISLEELRKYL